MEVQGRATRGDGGGVTRDDVFCAEKRKTGEKKTLWDQ